MSILSRSKYKLITAPSVLKLIKNSLFSTKQLSLNVTYVSWRWFPQLSPEVTANCAHPVHPSRHTSSRGSPTTGYASASRSPRASARARTRSREPSRRSTTRPRASCAGAAMWPRGRPASRMYPSCHHAWAPPQPRWPGPHPGPSGAPRFLFRSTVERVLPSLPLQIRSVARHVRSTRGVPVASGASRQLLCEARHRDAAEFAAFPAPSPVRT